MDASPEDAAPGDAEDDWSHDFLSAEELAVIAQRIADRADARHAERQAELVVAAAAVESAYPAAEQAVAADELARLAGMNRRLGQLQGGRTAHNTIEVNRRRAEAVAAEAVAAADEVARLSAGAEDAADAHAEDAAIEGHLELQREEYRQYKRQLAAREAARVAQQAAQQASSAAGRLSRLEDAGLSRSERHTLIIEAALAQNEEAAREADRVASHNRALAVLAARRAAGLVGWGDLLMLKERLHLQRSTAEWWHTDNYRASWRWHQYHLGCSEEDAKRVLP